MFNKKKFDKKNGEVRECKDCQTQFHTHKPLWRCNKCTSKHNFERAKKRHGEGIIPSGKWAGMKPKQKYPFSNITSESNNRFCSIRTSLSNAWKEYKKTGDRSIITNHYSKQLEEIRDNGILEWILDRRANDDLPNGKEKNKSKKQTNTEFPDTRGYHEY